MKAIDIINRLKEVIPRYTGIFSNDINVNSLTYAAGAVTCVCATPHGLEIGDEVFIHGALTPITITSINRAGALATAFTASNHDLTLGYQKTITLTGADQPEYNGVHNLVGVPNRRSFIFSVTGSPATPATGIIKMPEDIAAGYNGLHTVESVIDAYRFTYTITSAPESPALGGVIKLRKELAITGDVTLERFLQSYSGAPDERFWLVVVLGGTSASKDRQTMSDAISTSTSPNVVTRPRIIDPFSIYVIAPTADNLTDMTIRDGMNLVFNAINKGILFYRFPTDSIVETNIGVSFARHNMDQYDVARYVHRFDYEFVYDLVREDGANDDTSVAFRDIDLHFNSYLNSKHNEIMQTLVDLDDQPLP